VLPSKQRAQGGCEADMFAIHVGWKIQFILNLFMLKHGFQGLYSELEGFFCMIPSGKRLHNYGKSPFFMGKSTISMAIFNSYVKVPEGMGFFFILPMETPPNRSGDPPRTCRGLLVGWSTTLWLCQQFAIENGHRNSGFSHEKWWIFP